MSIRRRKPKSKSGVVSDSVKKYVKSVTKKSLPEMKYISTAVSAIEPVLSLTGPVAGYSYIEFANNLTIGAGLNQRLGAEIRLQGLHSKITYHNNSTVPVYVRRLVIGISGQDIDAGLDTMELFNSGGPGVNWTSAGNSLYVIQTPINHVSYKVYFDKTFKLGPVGSTDGTQTRMVNYFQKFGGKKIIYEGSTGGYALQDFRFAEIITAVCANQDATVGASLEFNRFSRVYFTDP